ncbi:MAG: hypothetical protein J7L95_02470, partial [Prolixibacteraceae bacterium]|nr:hypothetical protein [Prolixibacteraceae bacterium]
MNKLFLFFLLVLSGTQPAWSTIITGTNDQYAWQKLDFFCYADPVTQQKKFLFSLEFDGTGHCKTTVATTKTIFAFADFGIYRGMLFLSPDKNVELKLPPLRKKSFADKKNPFFKPVNFWFDTQNKADLTNQVSHFETAFNKLTNQYFNQLYFQQSRTIYDSVTNRLNSNFRSIASPVFLAHKKLMLKSLEMDVLRLKAEEVSAIFTTIDTAFWTHPAFISLFEKVFANKLSFEAKELKGTRLKKAVANGNAGFLLQH